MSYRIIGKYRGLAPEELDTADTLEEANYLLEEYQLAFGNTWEIWKEEVLENNPYCQCHLRNPRIRTVERGGGGKRDKPKKCEILEDGRICGKVTREGKNVCPDHIDRGSYVQQLMARQQQMEDADEAAAKGKVKLDNNATVKELLLILELNGPRTIERLVRDLNRDAKIVEAYIKALKRKKLVKTKTTKRGSTVVLLPNQS